MRITITGGYGYRNAGDEAQLASNLARWRKYVPGCRFTVLSPDVNYTGELHGQPDMEIYPATRTVWFGANKHPYYFKDEIRFRSRFRIISTWNRFLARLARLGLPFTILCSKQNATLHKVLRNSDILFISGGGFLTGSTLSRLWDNLLLIQIADIYGVQVLLSGQTLGGLDPNDDESLTLVRETMKIPALVYTRDNDMSVKTAREWGVADAKLTAGFDDALFSPAAGLGEINALVSENLSPGEYFVVNAHYWGTTRKAAKDVIKKIASLCDYINKAYCLKTVLIAMSPVDGEALADIKSCMETQASKFDFDYDPILTRGVIGNARICITMKHHPVVFSMGEGVPCMAFYSDDYYRQKNAGALGLFGMEDFLLDIEKVELGCIKNKIDELLKGHKISRRIQAKLAEYKKYDGEIIGKWLGHMLNQE